MRSPTYSTWHQGVRAIADLGDGSSVDRIAFCRTRDIPVPSKEAKRKRAGINPCSDGAGRRPSNGARPTSQVGNRLRQGSMRHHARLRQHRRSHRSGDRCRPRNRNRQPSIARSRRWATRYVRSGDDRDHAGGGEAAGALGRPTQPRRHGRNKDMVGRGELEADVHRHVSDDQRLRSLAGRSSHRGTRSGGAGRAYLWADPTEGLGRRPGCNDRIGCGQASDRLDRPAGLSCRRPACQRAGHGADDHHRRCGGKADWLPHGGELRRSLARCGIMPGDPVARRVCPLGAGSPILLSAGDLGDPLSVIPARTPSHLSYRPNTDRCVAPPPPLPLAGTRRSIA